MDDHDRTREQLLEELERLREENACLHDSEKKFRTLAESTDAQISVMQGDRYVYGNQALLDYYGVDLDDLLVTTVDDLTMGMIAAEELMRIAPQYEAAMARGETHFRVEFQDVEGRWFQTHATMTELDGQESFIAVIVDITELKRAQTEMYRADKMAALGQIVAGVAHEINNPNNFITFNLPILRRFVDAMRPPLERQLGDDPDATLLGMPLEAFFDDVYRLVENMEDGSRRITGIVSDLKHYVRSGEDQERRVQPLAPSVERVMTLVGKQVRKMVKRFDVEIAADLPLVEMNAGKIEQVLINLVINAGQAADKDDAWVQLTARPAVGDEGWVELRIQDNGAGIPRDVLDRIFEPFYTSKGRDQGTGLGLSISHRIIEEHGGRIDVDSRVGEGTCFSVLLPAACVRT